MGEGEWWEDIGSRIDCKSYDTTHHIILESLIIMGYFLRNNLIFLLMPIYQANATFQKKIERTSAPLCYCVVLIFMWIDFALVNWS